MGIMIIVSDSGVTQLRHVKWVEKICYILSFQQHWLLLLLFTTDLAYCYCVLKVNLSFLCVITFIVLDSVYCVNQFSSTVTCEDH